MNQEQNPKAIVASLYREHVVSLAQSLRSHFGDGPPDPEDIAQQAFEQLIQRERLDDIENPRAFLWRTGRNLIFNDRRAQQVRTRYDYELESLYFPPGGDEQSPERVLLARQQIEAIGRCLSAMPDRRRQAFNLHRIDGLSVSDTARQLGISRTAAVKHIARAAAEIDDCLREFNAISPLYDRPGEE